MKSYEIVWNHMKSYESRWNHMKSCEIRWNQMKADESRWKQMKFDEIIWNRMKSYEIRWNHMKSYEIRWNGMKSDEIIWNQMKSWFLEALSRPFSWVPCGTSHGYGPGAAGGRRCRHLATSLRGVFPAAEKKCHPKQKRYGAWRVIGDTSIVLLYNDDLQWSK